MHFGSAPALYMMEGETLYPGTPRASQRQVRTDCKEDWKEEGNMAFGQDGFLMHMDHPWTWTHHQYLNMAARDWTRWIFKTWTLLVCWYGLI